MSPVHNFNNWKNDFNLIEAKFTKTHSCFNFHRFDKIRRERNINLSFPVGFCVLLLFGHGWIILSSQHSHRNRKLNIIQSNEAPWKSWLPVLAKREWSREDQECCARSARWNCPWIRRPSGGPNPSLLCLCPLSIVFVTNKICRSFYVVRVDFSLSWLPINF